MGELMTIPRFLLPTTLEEAVTQALAPRTRRWSDVSQAERLERRIEGSTWVACLFCGAPTGERCTTKSGKPYQSHGNPSHAWRREYIQRLYAKPWRWVLKDDDPDFKLSKGDVLVCIAYWLDPEKVTVLYRESDGYDPSCNQYRHSVRQIPGPMGMPDPERLKAYEAAERERQRAIR